MTEHEHRWRTIYVTSRYDEETDGYRCRVTSECACGEVRTDG